LTNPERGRPKGGLDRERFLEMVGIDYSVAGARSIEHGPLKIELKEVEFFKSCSA